MSSETKPKDYLNVTTDFETSKKPIEIYLRIISKILKRPTIWELTDIWFAEMKYPIKLFGPRE